MEDRPQLLIFAMQRTWGNPVGSARVRPFGADTKIMIQVNGGSEESTVCDEREQ
jgi:hypothetical protein